MTSQVSLSLDLVGSIGTENAIASTNNSDSSFKDCLDQANESKGLAEKQNIETANKPQHKEIYENSSKTEKMDKIQSADESQQSSESKPVTDEIVKGIEEELVEDLTQILGITTDQLNDILASLNLTVLDLLVNDNMQQFLEAFFQVDDSFVLLLDPAISEKISELKGNMNNLLEKLNEHGINLEQLSNAHNDGNVQTDNIASQNTSQNEVESTLPDNNLLTNQNSEVQVEVSDQRSSSNENQQGSFQTQLEGEILDGSMIRDAMVKEIQTITISQEGQVGSQVDVADLINQIAEQVKVTLKDDSQSMVLQLKPEFLGKITFAVTSEQGVVTARFLAENAFVRDIIDNNLAALKSSLQDQGIQVDKMEVVVGDDGLFQNKEQEKFNDRQNKKNKKYAKINDSVEEPSNEPINEDLLDETQTIDYSV